MEKEKIPKSGRYADIPAEGISVVPVAAGPCTSEELTSVGTGVDVPPWAKIISVGAGAVQQST